jgi:hypothetical protein
MAIKGITIDLQSDTYALAPYLCQLGFDENQRKEILCCYDVLRVWRDKFDHLGKLVSFDHLSGVDDPPDVIAHFSGGVSLDMEHTSVEPPHRHWGEKLRGAQGGVVPPVSAKFENRSALLGAMNPSAGGGWASIENETVARYSLILNAMQSKIEKYPPGGVMVLNAYCHPSDVTLPHALAAACSEIQGLAGWEKWTFSFISRGNSIDYYSTIFSPTIPFEERRPPPPHNSSDLSKVAR